LVGYKENNKEQCNDHRKADEEFRRNFQYKHPFPVVRRRDPKENGLLSYRNIDPFPK